MNQESLRQALLSLAVFRNLLDTPVMAALLESLASPGDVGRYAQFVSRLYAAGTPSLAQHLGQLLEDDENPYITRIGRGEAPWPELEAGVARELEILQQAADLTPQALTQGMSGSLPTFRAEQKNLAQDYRRRCQNIGALGYGIYARHTMFCLDGSLHIQPVRSPDRTRLSSLIDYPRQQQIILDNTRALLSGRPAANILLTGDAGTGKSSTVKAVVNELWQAGLRILEIRKEQLHAIPQVLDQLSENPLKFILFIDDLSFQQDDDNFSALKAVLEGGLASRSQNVVIYATSNRRHLVKEQFSQREGDEIHRNDTIQELISLSERFGIQITFQRPDKKTYLHIVRHLAAQSGLTLPQEELDAQAERFALTRGGRSARAAKQFVDCLLAQP